MIEKLLMKKMTVVFRNTVNGHDGVNFDSQNQRHFLIGQAATN